MTGQEIRDLGYLAWRDPWAWMETMKGKRWNKLIEEERRHTHHLSHQPRIQRTSRQMEKEIEDAQHYVMMDGFTIGGGSIRVLLAGQNMMYWKWAWSHHKTRMTDVDVQGNTVWYVTSHDKRPYENHLICEDASGHRRWSKSGISTQVAVILPYCYYVKVVDFFTAIEVCVCEADSGNHERMLYRERNQEKDLVLYKRANRTLYVMSEDANGSALYALEGHTIQRLFSRASYHLPLGKGIDGTHMVLTRLSIVSNWVAHGTPMNHWVFPSEEIEWVNIINGLVMTIHEGAHTIWFCSPHKRPRPIFRIRAGGIETHPSSLWESSIEQPFIVKTPYQIPFMISIMNNRVTGLDNQYRIASPITFPSLEIHRFHTVSADQVRVPYITIKQKGKPKGMLVYVYGSYGEITPVDWPYQYWYPLLKRGWVIVFAMVRGGGDDRAAWANAGRRDHRHRSVDDYEAVIRAAQRNFRLEPHQTALYGRSAGGVPVGAMVSRYPDGSLMGAVFTEAPYVDVLRTTTNPDLPLTKGEYKEFGNPRDNIMEMKELLSISPVDSLPPDGAPGVFVLTHVGLLDRQVYAYESFKWIQKLRGASSEEERDSRHPKGKYVTFERKEEHVYRPESMPHLRAVDLAILDGWLEGTLRL